MKTHLSRLLSTLCLALAGGAGFFQAVPLCGEDSICVRVRIEIEQELTLTRQAFEARLNINNGTPNLLEGLQVDVTFADEAGNPVLATSDPDNTEALFFIRLSSHGQLPSTIPGNGSERIRWLIIPAPAAAQNKVDGQIYFVGASLRYTLGGEETRVETAPDSITVLPMPELTLDYFLPDEVYGDDPFSPEIEPPIPFNLGVRVANSGFGVAKDLKIESSQPTIVDNQQGLLVDFAIIGSEVNGQPATPNLLADFGDIAPSAAGVARWIMTSSLYGHFVDFSAAFTHADELGGQLTSLLTAVRTHFLVRDVLVDLPGRDAIRDFLARDGEMLTVYESDNSETAVTDLTPLASLSYDSGLIYRLEAGPSAGFSYVRMADPFSGTKDLVRAYRTDGKSLNLANVWLSRTFQVESRTWLYYLHLFDANNTTGASYLIEFGQLDQPNQSPVLADPGDYFLVAGSPLFFGVQAIDPDGTMPTLSTGPLPAGATFNDLGTGHGNMLWTPAVSQVGVFPIQFTASDGQFRDRRSATVYVAAHRLIDAWKSRYFAGVLDESIIGDDADPDHDTLTNIVEYALGTDPWLNQLYGVPIVTAREVDGQWFLFMTHVCRNDDPLLHCQVRATGDLRDPSSDWLILESTLAPDQTGLPANFSRYETKDAVELLPGTLRFLFLEASLLPVGG